MKVYFDTNVLVSAYVARGICADLLRFVLARHELMTGEVNLVELTRVLRDKLHATDSQIASALAELRSQIVVPKPGAPSDLPIKDPADRWVLASAAAGQADLLVTGDDDLLSVAAEAPVPIVSPRGCWDVLRRQE